MQLAAKPAATSALPAAQQRSASSSSLSLSLCVCEPAASHTHDHHQACALSLSFSLSLAAEMLRSFVHTDEHAFPIRICTHTTNGTCRIYISNLHIISTLAFDFRFSQREETSALRSRAPFFSFSFSTFLFVFYRFSSFSCSLLLPLPAERRRRCCRRRRSRRRCAKFFGFFRFLQNFFNTFCGCNTQETANF